MSLPRTLASSLQRLALTGLMLAAGSASAQWPSMAPAIAQDPAQEARIAAIVASMTLAQKIGQMTQPEIKSITPAEVSRHHIGSVLNGGGSRPAGNKYAAVGDWLALAQAYHEASIATAAKIPVLWGTDAVHGHNNVFGATIFPHNIGLGATRDATLVGEIGVATARAVRASGIAWVFGPTLAVAQDLRWGRSYESYSQDPALVAELGGAYIRGLQGRLGSEDGVLATAKHFIGDGGTDQGRDQGVSLASRAEMIAVHGAGYYSALAAGTQTVMASFNSWHELSAGTDPGKLHGSRLMLTEVLKNRLGFDGLVVSDWNGIEQVPGCSKSACAQALNAGIDLVMVPDDWQAFITNTMAQVQAGQIPIERIDDAVSRILRVKLRAGLFDRSPAQNRWAGQADALQARALARRAVGQSLVLLKNQQALLPLRRGLRLLVVGKSADSLQNQTGGWTLSWQGRDNVNADFPAGDSVLAGLREVAASLVFSETAEGVNPREFDAVIAVLGETPYAEGEGDIALTDTLRHSSRYPEDAAVLQRVAGRGVPVVTVFIAGRALYTNDLINASDAFVAAWLPGTEGKGVADRLFRSADASPAQDFTGRLPFDWPNQPCPMPRQPGQASAAPLFALGHGLRHASRGELDALPTDYASKGCGAARNTSASATLTTSTP